MPLRPPRPHLVRRAVRAAAVFVAHVSVLLAVLLPAGTAQAAERPVQGGRLDWGVKASFQSYVTGPVAKGGFALSGGAATVGENRFRFHSAAGSYDAATGEFTAAFRGGVRFTGHRAADGSYRLDLMLSRPTVRIGGGRAVLYADLRSKDKTTGTLTTARQIPFARLGLAGIDMRGGGSVVTLRELPATLTAEGARAFAGYYPAGTPLDPLSLSADVTAGARPGTTAPRPSGTPAGQAPAAGPLRDGAVDWGVRRTFREYVTGPVTGGRWTLADGAQDGGALFRFPRGAGGYDPAKRLLTAQFAGAVRFTGDHGLDLTLAAPRVRIEAGRGTLSADVTAAGTRRTAVPLVTFYAPRLTPVAGLVAVTEAPARLTAEGAAAFGGRYPAGTEMDPVTVSAALTDTARLPALPDLGRDAAATPAAATGGPVPRPSLAAAGAPAPPGAGSGLALPLGIAATVLLLGTATGYAVLRGRRSGAARAAGDQPPATT
ncbi:HtaA domain-containing protein [Streptomyces sp. NPDC089919]|uniref:HtaA domain-containing protein n=1 Tax=Streptomyces sp. NPDC089919 TaxID=3155188 RepID=UPI003448E14A